MERRELGRTGLRVSVLGFGGSEIGFECRRAEPRSTVAAGSARRRPQRHRHRGVLRRLRVARRPGRRGSTPGLPPVHQVRPLRGYRARRLEPGLPREEHRPEPRPPAYRPRRSAPASHLHGRRSASRGRDRGDRARAAAGPDSLHRLQRRRARGALRRRVWPLRHAADVRQRGRSGGAAPDAAAGPGPRGRRDRQTPDRQRRLAHGERPANAYHHAYWDRLQRLDYEFLRRPLAQSIATALRFTASLPGVTTLIVGTTQPGRWRENAALLAPGALPAAEMDAIQHRWQQIADDSWVGQR